MESHAGRSPIAYEAAGAVPGACGPGSGPVGQGRGFCLYHNLAATALADRVAGVPKRRGVRDRRPVAAQALGDPRNPKLSLP